MKKRLFLFLYNLDRAIASLSFGTSQETISSEVGRIAIGAGRTDGWTPKSKIVAYLAKFLAHWLDTTPDIWGPEHTARAIKNADRLDAADDGQDQ